MQTSNSQLFVKWDEDDDAARTIGVSAWVVATEGTVEFVDMDLPVSDSVEISLWHRKFFVDLHSNRYWMCVVISRIGALSWCGEAVSHSCIRMPRASGISKRSSVEEILLLSRRKNDMYKASLQRVHAPLLLHC